MKNLLISGIEFSDDTLEQKFEIKQAVEPMCLLLRIISKDLEGDGDNFETIIALHSSEMKALGKALVFAAEYVEELHKE